MMPITHTHLIVRSLQQGLRWIAQGLIRSYQYALSPLIGNRCRFAPSCSEYAVHSIQLWGLRRGGWLTGKRLLKCHPWHLGGYDPVPQPGATRASIDNREQPSCCPSSPYEPR